MFPVESQLDLEIAELLQMGNYGVGGQENFIDLYSVAFFNIKGFYIITPSQSECEDYRETFVPKFAYPAAKHYYGPCDIGHIKFQNILLWTNSNED